MISLMMLYQPVDEVGFSVAGHLDKNDGFFYDESNGFVGTIVDVGGTRFVLGRAARFQMRYEPR